MLRRHRPVLLPVFTILLQVGLVVAQTADSKDDDLKHFLTTILKDQETIFTAPARCSTWAHPASWVLLSTSAVSFTLDDAPARRLRETSDFETLNDIFSSQGGGIVLTAFPLGVLATGELLDRPELSRYGTKVTRAALNAVLAGTIVKAATQRSRPHTGDIYGFWEGGNSFYSGHSTVAWALAATTVRHFENHRWVPWVAYPLAGLISFSRVTSGDHYISDVVVGSSVGFAVGYWVD
jgi:membrane-associated phospholipid phosphatase